MEIPPLVGADLIVDRLDNGLELLLLPRPKAALVGLEIAYRTGSRHDPPGRGGLAHLFEHMLFQGSANVRPNEHFAHLERVGGVANASTSRDRTVYWEALGAEHLELALWLESDRMGFLLPGLAAETLETQRGVVLAERRQRVDNQPWGVAGELVNTTLWGAGHPYARPVIGAEADIRAITLGDAQQFFASHYQPANAVLALVGGFEPRQARVAIQRWFGELEARPRPVADAEPVAAAPSCDRHVVFDRVAQARLWWSWPLPAASDPQTAVAEVAAGVLAAGQASPLWDDLVQRRGLAQDIGAGVSAGDVASSFVVVATVRPGVAVEVVEAAIREHLERLARVGPSADDLVRATAGRLVGLLAAGERVERLADLLCLAHTRWGEARALDRLAATWLAVDGEAVRHFVAANLEPALATKVVCLPSVEGAA